jgi:mannose-6-phosphate isomerase-like protein (cupin superfamily)
MYKVNLQQKTQFEVLAKDGAEGVKVKYLIDKSAGANKFFLRYYSIEAGGHTPLDSHAGEHEVFIMKGCGRVKCGELEFNLGPGDALFIPSHEVHQFINTGEEPLEFLCVRGSDYLYEQTN